MKVLDIIKMNVKSYRFVTCFMEPDDNILFCNYPENIHIDLQIAKELVVNRLEFTKNKKHYLIMQFSNIADVTYEAMQYMKTPETGQRNILGAAFITTNPYSLAIAKIIAEFPKKVPAKFFDTEENAIIWINQLKEYHKVTQQ